MVDKSEKFRWLVRLGFAARGLVYLLIGLLALTSGRESGPEGAFDLLQNAPFGAPILYLAALGLVGYALFRVAQRIGHGASGVAHLALAWTAFQFAQGDKSTASDPAAEQAAGTLLSFPLGSLMLGLIGLGFIAAAAFQAKSALSADFRREIASDAPAIVAPLGRIGYAARAVVFAVIGWSLVRSAWFGVSEEVKSLGEAIATLAASGVLYTLVAVGLLVFGLFSLLLARFRIVPDLARADLRPGLR